MIIIKNKKIFIVLGCVFLLLVVGVIFYFGEANHASKEDKNPTQQINIEKLFENDASNDQTIDNNYLNRQYYIDDYTLVLNDDEYLIKQENSYNRFKGNFSVLNGNEIFNKISKQKLYSKYGLSVDKINTSNLYYVQAYYDTHIYSCVEKYSKDLNNNKELSFDFLIYFKETKDNQFLVGVTYLNSKPIVFDTSYF